MKRVMSSDPTTKHRTGKGRWAGWALSWVVVAAVVAGGCAESDPAESDPTEQIQGAWHDITPGHGVYLTFEEEGDWGLYLSSDVEGSSSPYAWGTYTLDGVEITMVDNPSSPTCGGDIAKWTVTFSENGDEANFAFIEDSCTSSSRGEDWTLIKQSP